MFKWIKKKILKSIVKDITKELPTYKDKALKLIEEHKDDILDKVKDAIKGVVTSFIKSKLG